NVWPRRVDERALCLRSDELLRGNDGAGLEEAILRAPRPRLAGQPARDQASHQRAGKRIGRAAWLSRTEAAQSRSGLLVAGQVAPSHDQRPVASRIFTGRHLRRGDAALPGRRLRTLAVDLRGLSPRMRPRLLPAGPRLLPAAAAGGVMDWPQIA